MSTSIVCAKCQRELVVDKTGVTVVEFCWFPPETKPYKFYSTDIYRCPTCGATVTRTSEKTTVFMCRDDGNVERLFEIARSAKKLEEHEHSYILGNFENKSQQEFVGNIVDFIIGLYNF